MNDHRLPLPALLALLSLAACARPAAGPAPVPQAVASGDPAVTDRADVIDALAAVTDDSAADRAVLEALADLEFGSLDPRAGRVRGQTGAADASVGNPDGDAALLFESGGGPDAAADVTRHLDVESFSRHSRVQYYIDFFQGPARDRFTIWLGRLPRYEGMIREQMRRYGVPEDLVYLAMIESGYSNTAVSRARAVGMWQFIASTGRRYGLSQDVWEDQRRDPFRATEAAARHLADLNEQFGSWYLAAAAYNAGAGRVSRGIDRLPGDGAASDSTFFELSDRRYLRLETRDYVPKLIAAALIARDPARYGFDSVPRLDPLTFDEVLIDDATGLDVLARLADTSTRTLVELNPQFVRGATPPKRAVVVRVPAGAGPTVARRWAELPARERVTFVTHRVARGETLSGIAQRYGISTGVLQAANPGVQARRMRIGQQLTVPVSPAAQRSVSRTAPRASTPAPVAAGAARYTVRSGDSLWSIAQRHRVTVTDLKRWNDLSGSLVRVGQELVVRAP